MIVADFLLVFCLVVLIGRTQAFLSHVPRAAQHSPTYKHYASKEKWVDDRDEEVSSQTRYTGESKDARDLQNMRYQDQEENVEIVKDDYYDEEDDTEYMEEDVYMDPPPPSNEREDEPIGNFWFNPKPGFDPVPPHHRERRPSRIEEETEFHRERRPRPRPRGAPRPKTTFRSGGPSTPEPVADFYDRLFWYGFNPDESIAPGDKTLFGGTKGKFNGLNFFEDDERRRRPPAMQRRKRPPQAFRADAWYDDIMDSLDSDYVEDDYIDEEDIEISKSTRRVSDEDRDIPKRGSLPPKDTDYSYEDDKDYTKGDVETKETVRAESVRREPNREVRPPRRRRPPPPQDVYYEERRYERRPRDPYLDRGRPRPPIRERSRDRVANQVSSWFGPDDVDQRRRPGDGVRSPRPPMRRRPQDDWSFTGFLDGIFGVNREEMEMNAAMYNRQMGLDQPGRPRRRSERPPRSRRHAYPYVDDRREPVPYDEIGIRDSPDVVDVDAVIEEEEEPKEPVKRRDRTIEERAAAFERVPPSGVPAWGPTGAVGVDARTKATLDALEDIREAKRKVELKEEQCIEAKEDIVVSKADFNLQKKRLLASMDDPRQVRSRLRQMQMGVQDAALSLRQARAELEVARERLTDLEDRNWALLSLYDADKAFQEVVETFREFEESERLETRIEEDSEVLDTDGPGSKSDKEVTDSNSSETSESHNKDESPDVDSEAQ